MSRMQRQSLVAYGQPLCETVADCPSPRGAEVLVRSERCGVCHSDLHLQDGYFSLGADKKLVRPGYVTVIHNGVVVQNHYELQGTTFFDRAPAYEPHPLKQPIRLQNHGDPVKYRNIWLREIVPVVGVKPTVKQ